MEPYQEALTYLRWIHGDPRIAERGLQIEIVGLKKNPETNRSRASFDHYNTCEQAAAAAIKLDNEGFDAYVCLSALDPKRSGQGRGKAVDARAISCFWTDIDVTNPLAPKTGKKPAPNRIVALEIARGCGVAPSVVVSSGYGLHCYWLFTETFFFEKDHVGKAGDLTRSFEVAVQDSARDHGHEIDSVSDLARILRVPGTHNWKVPNSPTEVHILIPRDHSKLARRTFADLYRHGKAISDTQKGSAVKAFELPTGVQLRAPNDEERERIRATIMLYYHASETFRDLWDYRQDSSFMSAKDKSASGFDFEMVKHYLGAGMRAQDMVFAIYMWRERHNKRPEKIFENRKYFADTLGNAQSSNPTKARKSALKEAVDMATGDSSRTQVPDQQAVLGPGVPNGDIPPPPPPSNLPSSSSTADPVDSTTAPPQATLAETGSDVPPECPSNGQKGASEPPNDDQSVPVGAAPDDRRKWALDGLKNVTVMPVLEVKKLGLTDSAFSYTMENGRVCHIRDSTVLFNQARFREKMSTVTNLVCNIVDKVAWDRFVQLTFIAAEEIANAELEMDKRFRFYLLEYLSKHAHGSQEGKITKKERDVAVMAGASFYDNGSVYVNHIEFREWVLKNGGTRYSDHESSQVYDRLKARSLRVSTREGGKRYRQRYKKIESKLLLSIQDTEEEERHYAGEDADDDES